MSVRNHRNDVKGFLRPGRDAGTRLAERTMLVPAPYHGAMPVCRYRWFRCAPPPANFLRTYRGKRKELVTISPHKLGPELVDVCRACTLDLPESSIRHISYRAPPLGVVE